MERENFFILLELPFNPPPTDDAEIKAVIQQKQQEWSRMRGDDQNRSKALQYMELIPQIEKVLLDPEARKKEAEEAQKISQEKIQPFEAELRILEGKGYLLPRELKELNEKYAPFGLSKTAIRSYLKVPVTDTPPKKTTSALVSTAADYDLVLKIRGHLEVLGKHDLYDFLEMTPENSHEQLLTQAQKIQHEAFHSVEKTGATTAQQLLSELAIAVFDSKESKAEYDTFLSVSTYPQLNDLVMKEFQRVGFISPEILMRLVNFGVTTYGANVLELEEYIRTFCSVYGISVDMASPQVSCPNCHTQNPRGTLFCTSCAAPLEGTCPECGTFFTDGQSVCKHCSFPVGNMGKALPYLEEAENALIENNWSSAQLALRYVDKYWPGHPQTEELHQRLDAMEQTYQETIQELEKAMTESRFYAAQEIIKTSKNHNLVLPQDLVYSIEQTIKEFEGQLEILKRRGQYNYDTLHSLGNNVSDSIELSRMLSQYPPEPPTSLTARPTQDYVQLNWGKSPSTGLIEYVVVRKENSVPLTAFDGDILYRGDQNSFRDEHLPALKQYFYSVFVKRGNSYSPMGAVAASPVQIIPEVKDLRITPGDKVSQLTWTPPENLTQVRVWRKLGGEQPHAPGDGMEIQTDRLDGFIDTGLKNDVLYWYYIVAVYSNENDEIFASHGIAESVTPHESIQPIENFTVEPSASEEDCYVVQWEHLPQENVLFFSTPARPNFALGKMMPVEQLLADYNRLPLEHQTSSSAEFKLRFHGGNYIFPASVSGKFAAIGTPVYITNIPDVQNISYDIIDSDLFINFRWPSGPLNQVTVAWRKDSFPTSITQKGTQTFTCTREQYDLDAGVLFRNLEKGIYYIRIYSTFLTPEDKLIYSEGQDLLVDNAPAKELFYGIKYSKPFFSSTYTVSLTLQAPETVDVPRGLLVGKVGSLPLSITDGEPLFEIERETDISTSITYQYKSHKLPKGMYVRLFFFDDHSYSRLRPIPSNSLKLT